MSAKKQDHVLTFELGEKSDELFIHADEAGLRLLARTIMRLADSAAKKRPDHDHLMTPEWAGTELTSARRVSKNTLVNQVTISTWLS